MIPSSTSPKPESQESIWLLVVAPTIWSVHFLSTYLTAAIWCAKLGNSDASFSSVRIAIGIYTVLALIGITIVARLGYRRHATRPLPLDVPHDADTAHDRHGFLGFATLLLSALSAVATIFVALVAVFFGSCD
jgi:hypothetical protein